MVNTSPFLNNPPTHRAIDACPRLGDRSRSSPRAQSAWSWWWWSSSSSSDPPSAAAAARNRLSLSRPNATLVEKSCLRTTLAPLDEQTALHGEVRQRHRVEEVRVSDAVDDPEPPEYRREQNNVEKAGDDGERRARMERRQFLRKQRQERQIPRRVPERGVRVHYASETRHAEYRERRTAVDEPNRQRRREKRGKEREHEPVKPDEVVEQLREEVPVRAQVRREVVRDEQVHVARSEPIVERRVAAKYIRGQPRQREEPRRRPREEFRRRRRRGVSRDLRRAPPRDLPPAHPAVHPRPVPLRAALRDCARRRREEHRERGDPSEVRARREPEPGHVRIPAAGA